MDADRKGAAMLLTVITHLIALSVGGAVGMFATALLLVGGSYDD